MTIGGWVVFGILSALIAACGIGIGVAMESKTGTIISTTISIGIIIAMLIGMLWFFKNTASGQRALVDEKSNISGIERSVTVYTANGDIIAEYKGKIDIETADGGYVKFDFGGKRYIYYNCFVETIAEIE